MLISVSRLKLQLSDVGTWAFWSHVGGGVTQNQAAARQNRNPANLMQKAKAIAASAATAVVTHSLQNARGTNVIALFDDAAPFSLTEPTLRPIEPLTDPALKFSLAVVIFAFIVGMVAVVARLVFFLLPQLWLSLCETV